MLRRQKVPDQHKSILAVMRTVQQGAHHFEICLLRCDRDWHNESYTLQNTRSLWPLHIIEKTTSQYRPELGIKPMFSTSALPTLPLACCPCYGVKHAQNLRL